MVMKATLDGIIEFEQMDLAVGSWRRASIERSAAGVDGALKVDLGMRTREIVQKGVIRAPSRSALMAKVDFIRDNQDGACHTMETSAGGERFEDMWIEKVMVSGTEYGGSGASCEIEIRYVQLRDISLCSE
jgi:hypothetical protein